MPDANYQSRLLSYTDGNDPLQMQRDAANLLADLIREVSDEDLRRAPEPDKWSITEILAHLADDEIVTCWRYRQMIESPGCTLAGFDQDAWAIMGRYTASNPADSLRLFQLLREANLRLLQGLTPAQWDCWGVHAERGRISVRDLARHMAGHDMNHIDQIRRILRRSEPRGTR